MKERAAMTGDGLTFGMWLKRYDMKTDLSGFVFSPSGEILMSQDQTDSRHEDLPTDKGNQPKT